jgi:hypothetical protein
VLPPDYLRRGDSKLYMSGEEFVRVAAAIAAAAGDGPWEVVPLIVAGLSISLLPKFIALWPRARAGGAQAAWW